MSSPILGFMKKIFAIGKRLRTLRGDITQEDFAKKAKIPFRSYQRYETGERMIPLRALLKIADLCNVDIDWILRGDLQRDIAIGQEKLKASLNLEVFIKTLQYILEKRIKNLLLGSKDMALKEEMERMLVEDDSGEQNISQIIRSCIEEAWERSKAVNFFEGSRPKSPLFLIFDRIQKIYGMGDNTKIDAINVLLNAFEGAGSTKRQNEGTKKGRE